MTGLELFGLAPPAADPTTHTALLRAARRLLLARRSVVGAVPAGPHAGVVGLLIELGLALSELGSRRVSVVDPNAIAPAFPTERLGDGIELAAGPPGFVTCEVTLPRPSATGGAPLSVTVTLPRSSAPPFECAPFRSTLDWHRERFELVLVDLTGLDRSGDHLEAWDLVDAVFMVARAGRTAEHELLHLERALPRDRNLGALLVG